MGINVLICSFIFILGICIGSFLNVCICRIPDGESIVNTPSHCINCGGRIKAYDLIPALSWLILSGKCRACGVRISAKYPLVELLTGIGFVFICLNTGGYAEFGFTAALFSALVVVFFIDLEHRIIPDGVNIFLLIMGILYNIMFFDVAMAVSAAIGFFAASVPMMLLGMMFKDGMGGGDIKLMAVCGLFLGWDRVLLAMFMGAFAALAVYMAAAPFRKSKDRTVTFGPYLAVGIMAAMLYGREIIDGYLGLFGV